MTRTQCEAGHDELVTPIEAVARAVVMVHADSRVPSVSDSASDVEAAMFSSFGKPPETSLEESVVIFAIC